MIPSLKVTLVWPECEIVQPSTKHFSCTAWREVCTVCSEIKVTTRGTICVLEGEELVDSEDLTDLSVCDIVCYEYARLASCDVECVLSEYKSLFRDNRNRFTVHNFKMTFVVY
jgi:hypothetical protein